MTPDSWHFKYSYTVRRFVENITNVDCHFLQIIVTCAREEANPEVSKEYEVLRRMIDSEESFLDVTALGEDLAMQVLK